MTSDLVTEQTQPRILVACVGNIFFGDDGFGIEVARRLMQRQSNQYNNQYAAQVHVIDFGIRGMDLAYTLLEPYDILVIVDAVPRGNAPGTLYVLEPDLAKLDTAMPATSTTPDAHSMDPVKVLAFARLLGATPPRTLVLGCEPVPFNPEDAEMHMGLSVPVSNAIDSALQMLDALIANLLSDQHQLQNSVVNAITSKNDYSCLSERNR
jgi:hydrogenase maturation protease